MAEGSQVEPESMEETVAAPELSLEATVGARPRGSSVDVNATLPAGDQTWLVEAVRNY